MKTFRDSNAIVWTVFEVRRQVAAAADRLSLPGGRYGDGWLCFESVSAKRRLMQYPERWREFADAELENLLGQARPAPRVAFRTSDDLNDGSTSPDLRPD